MATSPREQIVAHAKRIQDDQRYGEFTNPVMLGLLIAAGIIDHPNTRRFK